MDGLVDQPCYLVFFCFFNRSTRCPGWITRAQAGETGKLPGFDEVLRAHHIRSVRAAADGAFDAVGKLGLKMFQVATSQKVHIF